MTDETRIAWAAGVFEGEGCIFIGRRLKVQMTDEDVVRRLHLFLGVGIIMGPHFQPGTDKGTLRKPIWVWEATSEADARSVLRRFLPYLGERRRAKAIELFPELLDAEIPFPEELNYLEDVL